MRRLTGLVLVGVLAFTFVGSPASRAATVASTWPVGPQPFGLAVDEQTGKVYVANSGGAAPDGSGLFARGALSRAADLGGCFSRRHKSTV